METPRISNVPACSRPPTHAHTHTLPHRAAYHFSICIILSTDRPQPAEGQTINENTSIFVTIPPSPLRASEQPTAEALRQIACNRLAHSVHGLCATSVEKDIAQSTAAQKEVLEHDHKKKRTQSQHGNNSNNNKKTNHPPSATDALVWVSVWSGPSPGEIIKSNHH